MEKTALGLLLQNMREAKKLTLRELAQLAKIDHAYIHRLETGAKESPSDKALEKISLALKCSKRENEILLYVAAHSETPSGLVQFVLSDPKISFDVFMAAAGASFRGSARPDWPKLVERCRRILAEEE